MHTPDLSTTIQGVDAPIFITIIMPFTTQGNLMDFWYFVKMEVWKRNEGRWGGGRELKREREGL